MQKTRLENQRAGFGLYRFTEPEWSGEYFRGTVRAQARSRIPGGDGRNARVTFSVVLPPVIRLAYTGRPLGVYNRPVQKKEQPVDVVRKGLGAMEELMAAACRLPWWGAILLAFAAYIFLHPFAIMVVAPAEAGHLTAFRGIQFCKNVAATAQYVVPLLFLVVGVFSAIVNRGK
jgi:hypothetical protein